MSTQRDIAARGAPSLGRRLMLALAAAAFAACAANRVVTRLPDNTYVVDCKGELASCLAQVPALCSSNGHGYDVLGATERRESSGSPPEAYETVKARARVRCREAKAIFGPDPNPVIPAVEPMSQPVPSAGSAVPPPFPGASPAPPGASAPPSAATAPVAPAPAPAAPAPAPSSAPAPTPAPPSASILNPAPVAPAPPFQTR